MSTDHDYLLYWMIAARRTRCNFSLQRAVELAGELGKPLVVFEPLRAGYPYASDRFHRFVIDGMAANARAFGRASICYYPYVEPRPGAGAGLLEALASRACAVVTDWFPAFFLPRMITAAAGRLAVRVEAVDSNGLIPVADHGRPFPTARGYRAFFQRTLQTCLKEWPAENPVALLNTPSAVEIPQAIAARWPAVSGRDLEDPGELISTLPIDHAVPAVPARGGADAAAATLARFVTSKLALYADHGNDPDLDCTSRLSPYLHFGHIAAHEIFSVIMTHERWTSRRITKTRAGAREGWWGISAAAEHFLDQIVVWRELAFNGCAWTPDLHSYATLPAWARATLEAHLDDPRTETYTLPELDAAGTSDDVWNAAQRQLRTEGWFHGYMRMVWGKKILQWSVHPSDALAHMEALMNRYSLDGRDPVSYLNYGWVLGRYDRPWPEHAIFGTVRYMTSASAKRKLKMKEYLRKFA